MNLKKQVIGKKNKISLTLKKFYRSWSSDRRVLPDFLIIGAQKAGTSSLYSYLIQHPGIIPALDKEVHFFDSPSNRSKSLSWYRKYFCTISEKQRLQKKLGYLPLTGEATPSLLFDLHAPKFVAQVIPNVKLIVLLRDPVSRAFSHYHHNRKFKGREPLSFEEAIEQESNRTHDKIEFWQNHEDYIDVSIGHYAYVQRGFYDEQLNRWFQYLPRENFCIMKSEEFFNSPQYQLNKVISFLNLPNYQFDCSNVSNPSKYQTNLPIKTKEKLESKFQAHNKKLRKLLGWNSTW
jgi:hypothetical protein